MDEEGPVPSGNTTILTDDTLEYLRIVISEDMAEAATASQQLLMHLDPPFMGRLIELLASSAIRPQSKQGVVLFLKNNQNQMMKRKCDNYENAHLLLSYLLSDMDVESKRPLRQTFHSFLRCQCFDYGQWFNLAFKKILKKVDESTHELLKLEAYIEIWEELRQNVGGFGENLHKIIHTIPKFAKELSKELNGLANEQWETKYTEINKRIKQTFRVFDGEVQNIGQDYMYGGKLKMSSYLTLFSSRNQSIFAHVPPCPLSQSERHNLGLNCISEACRALLAIKNQLIEEMMEYYHFQERTYQLCELMLSTILYCDHYVDNCEFQRVMMSCVYVVQDNLVELRGQLVTQKQRVCFLSSLLLLMSSPDSQLAKVEKDPYGFISAADACFGCDQTFDRFSTFKNAVIFLLKKFIKDFNYKNIFFQDMLVLLNEALCPDLQQPNPQQRINLYKQFSFYNLRPDKRLDSLLLLMGVFAQQEMQDQKKEQPVDEMEEKEEVDIEEFDAFIERNIHALVGLQSPIVMLRLVRILRYYSYSTKCFECVSKEFTRGRAFQLQGFNLVLQSLRIQKQSKMLIHFIVSNFQPIISSTQSFEINWFRLLTTQFHGSILKGNVQTTLVLVNRILTQFSKDNSSYSQECLDILENIVTQESSHQIVSNLYENFCQFYSIALTKNCLHYKLEDKLGVISIFLLEKFPNVSKQLKELGLKTLVKMKKNLGKDQKTFNLYGIYLTRVKHSDEQIQSFYTTFFQNLRSKLPIDCLTKSTQTYQNTFNLSNLMIQLVTMKPEICLKRQGLLNLVYMMKRSSRSQKSCILSIILTYAYMRPKEFIAFLDQSLASKAYIKNILLLIQIKERKFIRIFNLACIKLVEISDQSIISEDAFTRFIENMKEVCRIRKIMHQNESKVLTKRTKKYPSTFLLQRQPGIHDGFTTADSILQEADVFEEFKKLYGQKKELIDSRLKQAQIMQLSFIVQNPENVGNQLEKIDEEEDQT